MANLLLHTDGEALDTSFLHGEDTKVTLPTLIRGLVNATRGSTERRTLRIASTSCRVAWKIDSMLHKLDDHDDDFTGTDVGAGMERDEGGVSESGERSGSMEDGGGFNWYDDRVQLDEGLRDC